MVSIYGLSEWKRCIQINIDSQKKFWKWLTRHELNGNNMSKMVDMGNVHDSKLQLLLHTDYKGRYILQGAFVSSLPNIWLNVLSYWTKMQNQIVKPSSESLK